MWIRRVMLCAALFAMGAPAAAQGYPGKAVRLVVPASPGGASDLVARMLAAPLAGILGQPFVVENRVTSGGIVGTQQVAESAPDGYTLLDATLKEDFPSISLPKREYMERAKAIWEELGLPKLKPQTPWFGYSLGEWPEELEEAAAAAVKGDYFETGKLLAQRRRNDVPMNTEVRGLPGKPKSESDE